MQTKQGLVAIALAIAHVGALGALSSSVFLVAPGAVEAQAREAAPAAAALEAPLAIDLPISAPRLAPVSDGRWRGGILLDEGFRSAIRLSAVEDQEIAHSISDVLLGASVLNALIVDAILVPAVQGEGEVVWRATGAFLLAQGLSVGINEIVKRAAGRARPFERECAEDPTRRGCDDEDRFRSFYSGHSGVAFTSAGFSCGMHLGRGLYDDTVADAIACGSSLAIAATTAILRVAADRHYLSDIVIGALTGFALGFLAPMVLVPDLRGRGDGAQGGLPEPQVQQMLVGGGPPPVAFSISGTF